MPGSYRASFEINNLSGYIQNTGTETGFMPISASKGPSKPVKCSNQEDVLVNFGNPSATFPEVFEALAFVQSAPCWVGRAIGTGAYWGGVDVLAASVVAFGGGRGDPATFNFTTATQATSYTAGSGDGKTVTFAGTATHGGAVNATLKIKVGSTYILASETGDAVTGADINGTGTFTKTTGAYNFTIAGTVGAIASVTGNQAAATYDLSSNKYVNINVDGILYENVNLSAGAAVPAAVTRAEAIAAINAVIPTGSGALPGTQATTSTNYIKVSGELTNGTSAKVIVSAPTTGNSALTTCFSSTGVTLSGVGTGTIGDIARVTGNVASTYDLSTNKYVNITIDNVLYENVNLSTGAGNPAAVTNVEVVAAINATITGTLASRKGTKVQIKGRLASLASGNVKVEVPTAGASALATVFSSGGGTLFAVGVDPTGPCPKYGESVYLEYSYTTNLSATVSHSFFSASPADDEFKVLIENVSGSKFILTLYQTVAGNDVYVKEYNYSLLREVDGYGKNLYIVDVFDNDSYLIAKVNLSYAGVTPVLTSTTAVALAGGDSGATPSAANYVTVWDYAKKVQDYPAKIFMNVNGLNLAYVTNILETYQYYSHQIGIVPLGYTTANAIIWRTTTAIDSKYTSLYTNWRKIYDVYNDSYAWISNVGSIGRKYAAMSDVYDGLSPAGTDEGVHGGQIKDWTTVQMEYSYDDSELADLDAAQINPVILDEVDGVKIYGDKTMAADLSDNSFVHTKRILDVITETIVKQVLHKQEFKNNDQLHQIMAKSKVETFLEPILAKELIKEARVICSSENNTAAVLTLRQFRLDVILKMTPNSQKCRLILTQVAQNTVMSQVVPA